jgi:hypothetical protein
LSAFLTFLSGYIISQNKLFAVDQLFNLLTAVPYRERGEEAYTIVSLLELATQKIADPDRT